MNQEFTEVIAAQTDLILKLEKELYITKDALNISSHAIAALTADNHRFEDELQNCGNTIASLSATLANSYKEIQSF